MKPGDASCCEWYHTTMSSSLAKRYVLWDDRAEREVGIYVSREEARLALALYKIGGKRAPARRGIGRDDRRDDYEIFEVDADYPGELSDPPRGSPRDLGGAKGMYDDHASYRPVADMDATPAQQLQHFEETIAWLKSLPPGSKVHGDAIESLVGRYEEQRALHARLLAEQAPGRGQGGQRRHLHGRTAGGMSVDRQRMLIRDQQTALAIREIKARLDAGRQTFAQAFAAVARATRLDKAQQQEIIKIFDVHSPQTRPHLALSLAAGRRIVSSRTTLDQLHAPMAPMPNPAMRARKTEAIDPLVASIIRESSKTPGETYSRDEARSLIRTHASIVERMAGKPTKLIARKIIEADIFGGLSTGQDLGTKVTALGGGKGYGVRLLNAAGKVVMEGRADTKREVGALIAEMLRWHQKTGGASKMAAASRERNARKGMTKGKDPMPGMDWLYGGPMPTGPLSNDAIHARAAKALGWTIEETQSMSFQSLREVVRKHDPALANEITRQIQSGEYIKGERRRTRSRAAGSMMPKPP